MKQIVKIFPTFGNNADEKINKYMAEYPAPIFVHSVTPITIQYAGEQSPGVLIVFEEPEDGVYPEPAWRRP